MIKAIETLYKGYRFRSRMEARWAIFFDALGVKWEYEKEGYDLRETYESWGLDHPKPEQPDSFFYLPDFYLIDLKTWVEIKPRESDGWPSDDACTKATLLTLMTGNTTVIVAGTPGSRDEESYSGFVFWGDGSDSDQQFGYCPKCKKVDVGFLAWAERICKDHEKCGHYRKDDLSDTPLILKAYEAARSARFEHGEKPQ